MGGALAQFLERGKKEQATLVPRQHSPPLLLHLLVWKQKGLLRSFKKMAHLFSPSIFRRIFLQPVLQLEGTLR